MVKAFLSFGAFLLLLIMPAKSIAQDTIVTFGLERETPSGQFRGPTLSTAQVDGVLRQYGVTSRLGTGPTPARDAANDAFNALNGLERDLEVKLRDALLSNSRVRRVERLDIFATNPRLTLFQNSNRLGVAVGGLGGDVRLRYKPSGIEGTICGTLTAQVRIDSIGVSAEYDPYTGFLVNGNTGVSVGRVTASCSSFLGGILLNAIKGLIDEEVIATKIIERELPQLINRTQLTETFAFSNLFGTLRAYVSEVPRPPFLSPSDYDDVLMALNEADRILSGRAFDGSGLRLEISLDRQPSQRLRVVLSHDAPKVISTTNNLTAMTYRIRPGFNTRDIVFYESYSADWQPVTGNNIFRNGNEYHIRGLPKGTSMRVIATSGVDSSITSRTIPLDPIEGIPTGCRTRTCASDGRRSGR